MRNTTLRVVYRRLEVMNSELNRRTLSRRIISRRNGAPQYQISVIPEIRDTCDILGRYEEEEMKTRLMWFMYNYPDIYDQGIREVPSFRFVPAE